ncbi:hypothetical protein RUND412_004481 [Rhizina undulata]
MSSLVSSDPSNPSPHGHFDSYNAHVAYNGCVKSNPHLCVMTIYQDVHFATGMTRFIFQARVDSKVIDHSELARLPEDERPEILDKDNQKDWAALAHEGSRGGSAPMLTCLGLSTEDEGVLWTTQRGYKRNDIQKYEKESWVVLQGFMMGPFDNLLIPWLQSKAGKVVADDMFKWLIHSDEMVPEKLELVHWKNQINDVIYVSAIEIELIARDTISSDTYGDADVESMSNSSVSWSMEKFFGSPEQTKEDLRREKLEMQGKGQRILMADHGDDEDDGFDECLRELLMLEEMELLDECDCWCPCGHELTPLATTLDENKLNGATKGNGVGHPSPHRKPSRPASLTFTNAHFILSPETIWPSYKPPYPSSHAYGPIIFDLVGSNITSSTNRKLTVESMHLGCSPQHTSCTITVSAYRGRKGKNFKELEAPLSTVVVKIADSRKGEVFEEVLFEDGDGFRKVNRIGLRAVDEEGMDVGFVLGALKVREHK